MSKKTKLAAALRPKAQNPEPNSVPGAEKGKKPVIFRLDPDAIHQLKQVALDQRKSVQGLLCEAVNRIFIENGKPTIAK
jgi:hypothetical protein